jgi:hypothetical protein
MYYNKGEVNMKNKFFIQGSIIAVIILVSSSLSPVVGYNSTKAFATASPLFSVRTKRAIQQDQNALTCEYLGKGNIFPIPSRDYRAFMVQKIIDRLSMIDEDEFDKFLALSINFLKENNIFIGGNIDNFIVILGQLQINPDEFKSEFMKRGVDEPSTFLGGCTIGAWYPGCLIMNTCFYIFIFLLAVYFYFFPFPPP